MAAPVFVNACSQKLGGDAAPIALRGERLALARMNLAGCGDALVLCELGSEGKLVESATFDARDKVAAFAALDKRFLALENAPIVQAVVGWTEAFNARDWDRFADVLDDELRVIDRRPIATGDRTDRAHLIESVQVGAELVPDMFLYVVRDYGVSEHTACGLLRVEGNAADGGRIEWEYIAVTTMRAGHKIYLFEEFDASDVDAALNRFQTLAEDT